MTTKFNIHPLTLTPTRPTASCSAPTQGSRSRPTALRYEWKRGRRRPASVCACAATPESWTSWSNTRSNLMGKQMQDKGQAHRRVRVLHKIKISSPCTTCQCRTCFPPRARPGGASNAPASGHGEAPHERGLGIYATRFRPVPHGLTSAASASTFAFSAGFGAASR